MRFLSPEWLDHLSSLAATASPGAALHVHQRVTGGPDGDVEYTLHVADGKVTFESGPGSADFDVDLTSDYETAVLVSRGFLTPAAAFAAGRLRVGGSISSLVDQQEALADIGRLLAGVSGATTY